VAKPNVHFGITALLIVVYGMMAPISIFLGYKWFITWLSTLFAGVLIDVDHLSPARVKKILKGGHGPIPGHLNYFHGWSALVGVILVCVNFKAYLPLTAYILHIFIDAGNRDNENSGPMGIAPVPDFLYKHWPDWLKYGRK